MVMIAVMVINPRFYFGGQGVTLKDRLSHML